jgi:hypothetical protein
MASKCVVCDEGTYTLKSGESQCKECPEGAFCLGGSNLIISSGYWRKSQDTDMVVQCPNTDSCLGGLDSTCAD